eukprot:2373680-Rhodomonas_salina.1
MTGQLPRVGARQAVVGHSRYPGITVTFRISTWYPDDVRSFRNSEEGIRFNSEGGLRLKVVFPNSEATVTPAGPVSRCWASGKGARPFHAALQQLKRHGAM